MKRVEQLFGSAPQGHEFNVHLVELVEIGVGGEPRIKDQFLGHLPGLLLPELNEAEHLVVLLIFPQIGVGVAEDLVFLLLGDESQEAFLAARTLCNVVLLKERIFSMKRNGVEVEMERDPSLESKLSDLIKPKLHQVRRGSRGDSTTVFGEKGPFGNNVETGP